MLYAVVVLDPESLSATSKIQSLVDDGHTIKRVFFYKHGVIACQLPHTPEWTRIARECNLELICCSGSVERRNVEIPANSGFELGGLGLLAECFIECDEVLQFG